MDPWASHRRRPYGHAGRPPSVRPKTRIFTVYLTWGEWQEIKHTSYLCNLSHADYARRCFFNAHRPPAREHPACLQAIQTLNRLYHKTAQLLALDARGADVPVDALLTAMATATVAARQILRKVP